MITRRGTLGLGLGASLAVAAPGVKAAPGKVVLYTGFTETEYNNAANAEFTRQTGIGVEMLVIPAAGAQVARVRAEKARPRADVLVSQTIPFMQSLGKDGLLDSFHTEAEASGELARQGYVDPDGYWHAWYFLTPALFWNTKRFASDPALAGVKPPSTWDDLLNPALKGQIALPSPQTTAIGYVLLATQMMRLGEAGAWDYERKLNANISQWTASPQLMVTLIEQGEAAVGAGWISDLLNSKIGRGQSIELALPPQSPMIVHTAGVIKGSPNPEGARKYVEFLQSEAAQGFNARYGYRPALSPNVPPPQGMPAADPASTLKYDTEWATKNFERLPKQWSRELGQ